MKSDSLSAVTSSLPVKPDSLLLRLLSTRLHRAGVSALVLATPDGQRFMIGDQTQNTEAELHIQRPRAILRALFSGMMGWAEGYMAGDWTTPDLRALTDWAARNETTLKQLFPGGPIKRQLNRLWHRWRDNSPRGSERNIAAHYDLGNAFYRPWLDKSMTYSSALFSHPDQSLADAQANKYERILSLAAPRKGDQLLEVGCGWGGFAHTVAQHPSLQLRGITLSREQLKEARQRISAAGAEQRIQLALQDYRAVDGQFDAIVSIEMFEAVGERYWPQFFQILHRLLKPGGRAVLQIICINPARFEHYRNNPDFIQRYIFPGGMLPTVDHVTGLAAQAGLRTGELQSFGLDYARTLQQWHEQFEAQWPTLEAQGFDARFRRMWRYYLAYCESGFRHGALDVVLFQLHRD